MSQPAQSEVPSASATEVKPAETTVAVPAAAATPAADPSAATAAAAATPAAAPAVNADASNGIPSAAETTTGTPQAAPPAEESTPAEPSQEGTAPAPAPAPANEPAPGPTWPDLAADHPLSRLLAELPGILTATGHDEVYGIRLDAAGSSSFHTKLILQKFLRANANDVGKAREQLAATLRWRKEFRPLEAKTAVFSRARFDKLGYVTVLEGVPGSDRPEVVTFNIYGAVKDNKATFEDVDGFLRWRVGLMELGLEKLHLADARTPIPDYGQGPDPYQGYQVHDYLQVSFLRQDPHVKAASKKTIELFTRCYPETLSRKFFVNVPAVMGWLFAALKLLLPRDTVRKFTVLADGAQLAAELGPNLPPAYGGSGPDLEAVGEVLKME